MTNRERLQISGLCGYVGLGTFMLGPLIVAMSLNLSPSFWGPASFISGIVVGCVVFAVTWRNSSRIVRWLDSE